MAQQDRHLTTEQLSVYLDQQLSAEEQEQSADHLTSCEQCQSELAALRRTVALLRALPQVQPPHSFALPIDSVAISASSKPAVSIVTGARRVVPRPVRTTLRTLCALAAVIGIFFMLSGLLSLGSHGGASMSASSSNSAGMAPHADYGATRKANESQPHSVTRPYSPLAPAATAQAVPGSAHDQANEPDVATAPVFFDLNNPDLRLLLGAIMMVLGLSGVILFARLGKHRQQE